MSDTTDPGKIVDKAREYRRLAGSARGLISTLRVATHEVRISPRRGLLGLLRRNKSSASTADEWVPLEGLDGLVLQEALFVVRDRFKQRAAELEARLTVKPEERS